MAHHADAHRRGQLAAERERDETMAQLLAVGSVLCGDDKGEANDHPRRTPMLDQARALVRELAEARAALGAPAVPRDESVPPPGWSYYKFMDDDGCERESLHPRRAQVVAPLQEAWRIYDREHGYAPASPPAAPAPSPAEKQQTCITCGESVKGTKRATTGAGWYHVPQCRPPTAAPAPSGQVSKAGKACSACNGVIGCHEPGCERARLDSDVERRSPAAPGPIDPTCRHGVMTCRFVCDDCGKVMPEDLAEKARDALRKALSETGRPPTDPAEVERLRTAKSRAILQAQTWAMEAKAQRSIVAGVLSMLGIHQRPGYEEQQVRDWLAASVDDQTKTGEKWRDRCSQLRSGIDRAAHALCDRDLSHEIKIDTAIECLDWAVGGLRDDPPLRILGGRGARSASERQIEHARWAVQVADQGKFCGDSRDLADYRVIVRVHGDGT